MAGFRWRLRPRFLRDVSHISMETTLLGEHVDFPVGASPAAFHCLAHPDGELATVKGKKIHLVCPYRDFIPNSLFRSGHSDGG